MVEEPYDTYIDFGLDDEATSFASPSDSQTLPPFLVEILAALNSGPPSSQVGESAANTLTFPSPSAAPSTSYAQSISPSYYPFPTPSSSLRSSLSEHHPWTSVRPSDTIRVHGSLPILPVPSTPVFSVPPASFVLPAPPPPNPYVYVPPAISRHTPSKRLQEQIEDPGRREQSSPRKRRRAVPPRASALDVDYALNTIYDCPPIPEGSVEAAPGGPGVVPSMDWGVLPAPESSDVAGPSVVDKENVPVPRKPRKRARKDKSDGSATSKKRGRKTALSNAPEALNVPVTPYSGIHSIEYGPRLAPAAIEAPVSISATYPELTSEFYEELYNIACDVAQELKHTPGTPISSPAGCLSQYYSLDASNTTYPNVPGPSSTSTSTHNTREDSSGPPSAATKGKRRRPQSLPPNKPPKKRQRTDNPANANTLPPAVDTSAQPEKREKPFACPFATDTDDPCSTRLGRQTDIRRHVRTKHLGYRAFCAHEIHRGKPFELSREDGVLRHLAFRTCIGAAALKALVKKRKKEMKKMKKTEDTAGTEGTEDDTEDAEDVEDAETKRWAARVRRAVSRDCTLCRMPCYHTRRFWRGIERLPGETPDTLERWFAKYGRVERCLCGPCQNISEAELRGEVMVAILDSEQVADTHPSATARPTARPSSSGTLAPAASPRESLDVAAIADHAEWDDDKLPPEEEEGVDEDIPEPPLPALVADTVAVAAQDSDNDASITHISGAAEGTPPELQAVFEILSGLPDADLESLLRRLDGSQSESDRTPDGKADS
ncbi:hypothetical protein V8D89_014482 [Ganoderma adspersum]